jgi:hypothetical protein
MAVIAPDYATSSKFLSQLAELDRKLQKQSTRKYLDQLIHDEFNQEGKQSVRYLQAGRYEIFVEASHKTSDAFDHLTARLGVIQM